MRNRFFGAVAADLSGIEPVWTNGIVEELALPPEAQWKHFDGHMVTDDRIIRTVNLEQPFTDMPIEDVRAYWSRVYELNERAPYGSFVQDVAPYGWTKMGFCAHVLTLSDTAVRTYHLDEGDKLPVYTEQPITSEQREALWTATRLA